MKTVILAGGYGTRLSEETEARPKPMIGIGGMPVLWHIMKIYSHYGFNEFVICLGYKGYVIKEYFANYFLHRSDVTIDLKDNSFQFHQSSAEPWKITLVETGLHTMTGGRIKRVAPYLGGEPFLLTYGDGVADVDIAGLLQFHRSGKRLATVTAVEPPGRFGALDLQADRVLSFQEKPAGDNSWINGGFFVLEPEVLGYIKDDSTFFEKEPLTALAREGQLGAWKHTGFWHPMDTLRDKTYLNSLAEQGKAPWMLWR
ncbi:MAG: glucose-1-phosphate cytidylyltransferase [Elusimicrobiaceae bacterium]|nr:glucose-1-phosphate cytidylyltransferase [Elusimicrobiaceae bacterium]